MLPWKRIRNSKKTYPSPLKRLAQCNFDPATEIAPKSPFLWVNRSPIRYDFRAGAKAIRYFVNMALKTRRKEGRRRTEWLENASRITRTGNLLLFLTLAVLGKFLLGGVKPLAIFCLVRGLLFVISLWLFCEHSKLVQQEARFSLYSLHKVMLDTFNFVPYIFFSFFEYLVLPKSAQNEHEL